MYLRALWTDEPAISRRPSKLLFWHIDAENGEHLTTEPRSNGEYVVATREAATPERPERSFKAAMTVVRALARNKDPRQLPNGKNAWGGKVGDKKKAAENHRRWINRNKVEDDPESNDDDDEESDVEGDPVQSLSAEETLWRQEREDFVHVCPISPFLSPSSLLPSLAPSPPSPKCFLISKRDFTGTL
ncbi:hypothetical protein C7M84_014631 [Penaeus vannamei]|uniref:Uncharacterized protein n=1 Tax=Penaeus vannamei TaxID=6689 RepID=A0A3R7M4Y8_PENVA|nr:hypothetical protein C7M84_014631 [Penaeus vannamei]